MGTTAVATLVATHGEVHGAFTTTQAMSFQAQRKLNALPSRAQASHPCASHSEQPTLVAQLTLAAQSAPVAFQVAQIHPRLVQLSRLQISKLTIKPGTFSAYFSADLAFPNSNLAPGVYHISTAQEYAFIPRYSKPNREQHLSQEVIELTNALAQQTTLVNQLLQRALDEVSRSRTRANKEPLQ
ncbi:hypothetical protein ACFX14_037705 [Malus domestica]